jgi:tRNA-dihydrouridine synthase B
LGRHRADEIESLLPLLNCYPIESVTIHPRTGVQMYTGRPDLDAFERCLPLTRHRVIYNGDIVSKQCFDKLRVRFPQIKTWMIGRGVMKNPFLPITIKGLAIKAESCLDQFRGFHDALFARYRSALFGPSHLLGRMKGLWSYFSDAFNNGHDLRKKIHKAQTIDHYWEVVNQFFDGHPIRQGGDQTGDWQ